MKKWSVTLGLWCVLLLGELQNVLAQEPAYLKDMPTVSEIKERIKGANEAQTLGRQCAAFSILWDWRLFPIMDGQSQSSLALRAEYKNAISQLDAKSLDDKIDKSEWWRMCANGRSGYHPSTGKPDNDYPALDEPVKNDELAALFKPSVMAVYEKEKEKADVITQTAERNRIILEAQAEKIQQQERVLFWSKGIVLGLIALSLAFWLLRRIALYQWMLARKKCQFKHSYKGTGIALDTANQVVYFKIKKLEKSYPFNDIREWKYNVSTGGQVIGGGVYGGGRNIATAIRNEKESGLFVNVRDIDHPQWRIAFPYNGKMETELLRWMEIFRQYVNNE